MGLGKQFDWRAWSLLVMTGMLGLSCGAFVVLAWHYRQPVPSAASEAAEMDLAPVCSLDEVQAQRLAKSLQIRRTLQSNVAVMARLHASVIRQLALANQLLKQQFEIDPRGNYSYEKDTGVIYRLTAGKPAGDKAMPTNPDFASKSKPQPQFHRQLSSGEERRQFIRLYIQKQQLLESIVIFGRALNAQRGQLQKLNQVLTAEYNVEPGCHYVVSLAKNALYEIRVSEPVLKSPPQVAQVSEHSDSAMVR